MYQDDYRSAFGKLAPSEAWKAETLAKMRALEARRDDPLAPETTKPEGPAPARKTVSFAARMRRAALPIAAVAMLAILPMTTLRGCGSSAAGGTVYQMTDEAAPAAQNERAAARAEDGMADGLPEAGASPEEALVGGMAPAASSAAMASAAETAPAEAPAAEEAMDAPADAGQKSESRAAPYAWGTKPFAQLEASDLAAARVTLTPPDTTLEVPDLAALTALLQEVVVYEQDDTYRECSGQGVTFLLTRADGTQTRVMAYNPYVVIDGVGYRTRYEPCEALSGYANGLLQSGAAIVETEEP